MGSSTYDQLDEILDILAAGLELLRAERPPLLALALEDLVLRHGEGWGSRRRSALGVPLPCGAEREHSRLAV